MPPMSATGISISGRLAGARVQRGFTLLELVAVIAIVGLVAGMVVLAYSDERRTAVVREQAQRLARVIEIAAQEAILTGRPLGLALDGAGYGIVRRERGRWRAVAGDALFEAHTVPAGIEIGIAGAPFTAPGDAALVFLPSGERLGAGIEVNDSVSGMRLVLEADRSGRYVVSAP